MALEVLCSQDQGQVRVRLDAIEERLDHFGTLLQSILDLLVKKTSDDTILHENDTAAERPRKKPRNTVKSSGNDINDDTAASTPLPADPSIPNEILEAVVETYFTYCHNQPYSFFHEGNFRHRLLTDSLPEYLILAVFAYSVRYCAHSYFANNPHEMSVLYANQSWKSVVKNCFTANKAADLSIVQTIALLALFDFTAGQTRHGSAWVKIGMAVRIAQDLGLMLDASPNLPSPDREERHRTFWSVYLLDRLVSCGRGRPPAIVDSSCHLQLPCDDAIWKEGQWKKTPTLDELTNRTMVNSEPQGYFAHVIVLAYTLGRGAQYMLQDFNIRSRCPPWDPSSDFAAIESDLLHLETRLETSKPVQEILAPHIDEYGVVDHQRIGHILFARALFHLSYCMLNHPFLLRRRIENSRMTAPSSFLARTNQTGFVHAQSMLELIRLARTMGCVFQSSFSGYCITVAGSIALLHMRGDGSQLSSTARSLVHEAISYLEDVGRYWNNVSTMATILRESAKNAVAFEDFRTSSPQIAPLSGPNTDTMWRLVDYSTMSNEVAAGLRETLNPDADMWLDSWTDLFGIMDATTADFPTFADGMGDLYDGLG
ncbi:hypothetical protein AYL99_06060 [Fonsecaea erecta]|uniref:Xylanolytic transcriptional activator regulatory domain-containing protein n=1 Tax=Fonsecaea erecta TaxID=1367422 RepID=A0A178ZHU5_9EURO|nr:hypothetical protein AYL99_06060 [Fonsecaea erecta]OAP58763.1 hypothetical protein AYL99_06060 [Fonsecaea erecta]